MFVIEHRSMGKKRDRLDEVRFRCDCGHIWEAAPDRVEESGEEFHDWTYHCACPECGEEAGQDPGQRRMLKMWANATGPRTEEGRAASAANLEGHPTPEETQRTRFNAMKHGLDAKVATYFPAKPGGYDACQGCPYRENRCLVEEARGGPCIQRSELYFQNHLAFEHKNPELLRDRMASLQASIASIIDMMILDIVRRGVTITAPRWYIHPEDGFQIAEYTDEDGNLRLLTEVNAHPLLNPLIDYLKKNGQTLADAGMTLRQQDDDALLEGYIDSKRLDRETEGEQRERQTAALERLTGLVESAQQDRGKDPVLLEYQEQEALDG